MSKDVTANTDPGVRHSLESIDWNFTGREKGQDIETIHPYPAKFIGEIPRTLITNLPIPTNTAVLDPFCGSGTALTESQKQGFSSVGIDLNPIACLISRVKTSPLVGGFERLAVKIANAARENRDPHRWKIPNVDHWFEAEIQEAIAALVQEIRMCGNEEAEDLLSLALSSILVRVSNQDSDTRYAAVKKHITKGKVFDLFLAACGKIKKALAQRNWTLHSTRVIEGDTLKIDPAQVGLPIGIVVTSPPYPNAYEYWLYHKYRMWWLGHDPLSVKSQEIGARAHFFKRDHHTEGHFWDQMRRVFVLIDSVLVPSGFACFVIGRSRIHGRIVDNSHIIRKIAREREMGLIGRFERVISEKRKSFNLSHANIKTETILVFQKG